MEAVRKIFRMLENGGTPIVDDYAAAYKELDENEPPEGFASWRDAALDERKRRVKAEEELKDYTVLQPNRDALMTIFKSLRGHRNLAEMVQGHILHWRKALKFWKFSADGVSADDVSFAEHELKALDDIEAACKTYMEQAANALMDSTGDANTIYVTAYGAEGQRTSTYTTTSFDTHHEVNVMTGALELERAVRMRNVQFKPFKLGSLRIEPHIEEHGVYFTFSGGPRDGERIMLNPCTHGSYHYERFRREDIPEMGLRIYKVDAEKRILIYES